VKPPRASARGARARPRDETPPPEAAHADGWEPVDLEALSAHWETSLDAAQSANVAARPYLTADELRLHSTRLRDERFATAQLLDALARDEHAGALFFHRTLPWESKRQLGLPVGITACVFDLDGVLTASAETHAAAWSQTFDEFITARTEQTHGRFTPFSASIDYPEHIHGRPRLEGVRAFLASRGIRLPEGAPEDPPGSRTVHGLANRKNEMLLRRLDREGVSPFAGARRYLEAARHARVRRAVVSASANTEVILERAALSELVELRIDGNTMEALGLRAKPAPDTLLAACSELGVEPAHAAAFETTDAGIRAARAAGLGFVIAVDRDRTDRPGRRGGPNEIVGDLAELLERHASP
jgi:HAD superfamily hydrolase (TIGR01509 family)